MFQLPQRGGGSQPPDLTPHTPSTTADQLLEGRGGAAFIHPSGADGGDGGSWWGGAAGTPVNKQARCRHQLLNASIRLSPLGKRSHPLACAQKKRAQKRGQKFSHRCAHGEMTAHTGADKSKYLKCLQNVSVVSCVCHV